MNFFDKSLSVLTNVKKTPVLNTIFNKVMIKKYLEDPRNITVVLVLKFIYTLVIIFGFFLLNYFLVHNYKKNEDICFSNISGSIATGKEIAECFSDYAKYLAHSNKDIDEYGRKHLVGKWVSNKNSCFYNHTLKADGTFYSEKVKCYVGFSQYKGTWAVDDGQLIWFVRDGGNTMKDANKIKWITEDYFELTESDGSQSGFDRLIEYKANDQKKHSSFKDEDVNSGYASAKANNITTHKFCRIAKTYMTRGFITGCDKYVTELIVGNNIKPSAKKMAQEKVVEFNQCERIVKGYWNPIIQDAHEKETEDRLDQRPCNSIVPIDCAQSHEESITKMFLEEELFYCSILNPQSPNYNHPLNDAIDRLGQIVKRVEKGEVLSMDDKVMLRQDFLTETNFSTYEERKEYIIQLYHLYGLVGGVEGIWK